MIADWAEEKKNLEKEKEDLLQQSKQMQDAIREFNEKKKGTTA
jgi:predicted  nucleic acid-binding Zn-ribbon protein